MGATESPAAPRPSRSQSVWANRIRASAGPHLIALVPGLVAVALMIVWAAHNGGYDADTWYWGALLLLSVVASTAVVLGPSRLRLFGSRASSIAVIAFASYVAWSYLSIAWAQAPGTALEGSNRALLYLLVFTLMAMLPWTAEGALVALLTFALGIGVIAVVILLRLASGAHVETLLIDGRLAAPTGYFNGSVALFTMGALVAVALAARRELPGLLRGLLIAFASASLQLAVVGQSRGWLFTLPLVLIAAIAVVQDRLRVAAVAVLPIVAAIVPVHKLIAVFDSNDPAALRHAAQTAGREALVLCFVMLVAGTLLAWGQSLMRPPTLSRSWRRALGAALGALALAGGCAGAIAATHNHPVSFVKRQWRGFSHPPTGTVSGSHFATVGSGRYDFWRVSLDAVLAHPIGGLGQDNFDDYYITRRHTDEEPAWTHSLEMRLLAHTGFVGFALFLTFIVSALVAVLRVRRRRDEVGTASGERPTGERPAGERGSGLRTNLERAVACAALLPLVVWLIHGSVDWFWEIPALSGPALGFLGMAIAVSNGPSTTSSAPSGRRRVPVAAVYVGGGLALLLAVVVLGLPYLSVREVSIAGDLRASDPAAALSALSTAADLNPLSADPGRVGGTIALETGRFATAESSFGQAISRERGGWFAWFGAGLAASGRGDAAQAHRDLEVAASINTRQPAVREALARVDSRHPLSPVAALQGLLLAQ